MEREEAIKVLNTYDVNFDEYTAEEIAEAFDMAIEALQEQTTPTIPTFTESEEAYKAWTGEEMGKTSDEINEMNKEIIKDILKMMPTAYLLEALGVSTFEELTEQAYAVQADDRLEPNKIYCSPLVAENVEVVVRCKDCRFSEVSQNGNSGVSAMYCRAFTFKPMVAEDDYCSYGQRLSNMLKEYEKRREP